MTLATDIEFVSQELVGLLGTEAQVEPFSHRYTDFDLKKAYEIVSRVCDLRQARGETPIGRKIGFTNKSIWCDLGIAAPVWNYVFDNTVKNEQTRVRLVGMPEPRIEPELVLHLAEPPAPGMTTGELFQCIDWIAPGFEIVYSIFPNWSFTAADAAAAYGVHGSLFVGEKLKVNSEKPSHLAMISTFDVKLTNNAGVSRNGHARNVLGGPLEALRFLVEEIARFPCCEPLQAGELVTTGTLTEAMPALAGESWSVRFEGSKLTPLQLGFD